MNSKSGKSQRIHHNYTKIYLLTALLCVVAAVVAGLLVLHFSNIQAPAHAEETQTPAASTAPATASPTEGAQPSEASETPNPTTEAPVSGSVERLTFTANDLKKVSPLSLVNLEHPCEAITSIGVVNVYQDRAEKGYTLSLKNSTIDLNKIALAPLVELNTALTAQYPEYSLLILCGYTSDMMLTDCTAADKEQPKADEHVTGLAFDCRYSVKVEGKDPVGVQLSAADAATQTAFLLKKGAELGFIQSKAKLAGHTNNDLRHIRYVGVPHAQFIYENNLTLEDYLLYLKDYNFNKRLTLEDAAGAKYEVYFVKATGEETTVNVPKDSNYEVWGNNVDGFVVTIKMP